ncbi:MAG: hypothetical protein QM747_20630 [Nocardioides sp.]
MRSLGLRVVGDPERLLPPEHDAPADDATEAAEPTVAVQTAAAGVVGALEAALRVERRERPPAAPPRVVPLAEVPGRGIAAELRRRARRRLPGGRA